MTRAFLYIMILALAGCQGPNPNPETPEKAEASTAAVDLGMHPDWTAQSSIYEVNIRQHTPEGTLNAFAEKLPELKELGVEILWLMPVQPIGVKNRKGGLGSYYSISDYTAINPEFGTMEDFKNLVKEAHDMGFKVILDWVANHTAYDHVWTETRPEWYTRVDGEIVSPNDDWTDVADLNYDAPGLRQAMRESMKFWVKEADIDGFRCDVAYMVPMEFWNRTRAALDSLKPVFMLAEAEGPEFHDQGFDMTYGWELHHLMNEIAAGNRKLTALDEYREKEDSLYGPNDYRMFFTTNHDENSWNGTIEDRLGKNAKNFFVLCATFPNSMPLVYSGQEYGLNKALSFFEKDTVVATDSSLFDWYAQIIGLKMAHPSLKMGRLQGDYQGLSADENSFGYLREKDGNLLVVALNFGDIPATVTLPPDIDASALEDAFTAEPAKLNGAEIELDPHSYKLFSLTP